MSEKILITGGTGQDASFLAKLHLERGDFVYLGVRRSASRQGFWRLEKLKINKNKNLEIIDLDLLDFYNLQKVIKTHQFHRIYNLAAQSFVGISYTQPLSTHLINGVAVGHILEIIKNDSPSTKMYQASTSEMFGNSVMPKKGYDELSPMVPESPYGASKLYAHNMVKIYREAYRLFVCSGILFNHESYLRGDEFVTKKIVNHFKNSYNDVLELGNLYSVRDWGDAEDYVQAMALMLDSQKPKDYVVATGKGYSVKDFVNIVYRNLIWKGEGLSEKGYTPDGVLRVQISEKFYRPTEVNYLLGNSNLIRKELGWKPTTNFKKLVEKMLEN